MATTNWELAENFRAGYLHTFNSLQKFVVTMADYKKNKGKKTLFGQDKGLYSYKKFEEALKDTLTAMAMDGIVSRNANEGEYREKLINLIGGFADVFPNWEDAYSFAGNFFFKNAENYENVIRQLLLDH